MLFQTVSVTPHVSQVSYVGYDGLLFSYYVNGTEIFGMYSNNSLSVNSSIWNGNEHTWYIQQANSETGKLYGKVITSPSLALINASWFQGAMNSNNGYACLGSQWNSDEDLLFLTSAKVGGRGVISIGFPVKEITGFLSVINLHGGGLFLVTQDNQVLIEGLPHTQIMVSNGSISFKLERNNQSSDRINVSCHADPDSGADHGSLEASLLSISNKDYAVHCSQLEIMGVKSVCSRS